MISKKNEQIQAIELRKRGKTYNEILSVISVSKSTLSLWLRDVGLAKAQRQRITHRKHASQIRGGEAKRNIRIQATKKILQESRKTLGTFTERDLFILGIALYWAEGSKEKTYRPSVPVEFANSDPDMIILYLRWVRSFLHVNDADIQLILHIHKNRQEDTERFKSFWSEKTRLSLKHFGSNVIKKHNPKTKRKNTGDSYKGLLAIRIKRSTMLNRRIQGWIYGIIEAHSE